MKRFIACALTLCFFTLQIETLVCAAQSPSKDQPQVVKAVAPNYPAVALTLRASGLVSVMVEINAQGEVVLATATSGNKFLYPVSEIAAKRWKFVASSLKLREAVLSFNFIITPKDTPSHDTLPVFLPPYSVEIRDWNRVVLVTTHSPFKPSTLSRRRNRIRK